MDRQRQQQSERLRHNQSRRRTEMAEKKVENDDSVFAKNVSDDHMYLQSGCLYPGETGIVTTGELEDNPNRLKKVK